MHHAKWDSCINFEYFTVWKEECACPDPGINIWDWDLAHCPWKKANEQSPQRVCHPRLPQEVDFQALQTGFGSCQLAELSITITTLGLYNLQLWSLSYTVLTHLPYMFYNIPADSRCNPSLQLSFMKKESTAFVKKTWACRHLTSWTTPMFSLEFKEELQLGNPSNPSIMIQVGLRLWYEPYVWSYLKVVCIYFNNLHWASVAWWPLRMFFNSPRQAEFCS